MEKEKYLSAILSLKNIDLEDSQNFLGLSSSLKELISLGNNTNKEKLNFKAKLITDLANNLDTDESEATRLKKLAIYDKILELFRVRDDIMVILTLIRNNSKNKPNYNLVPKLESSKGFKIFTFLDLYFTNCENLHEIVKILELINQYEMNYENVLVNLIKLNFVNILNKYEVKSNSWIKNYISKEENFNEALTYMESYLREE